MVTRYYSRRVKNPSGSETVRLMALSDTSVQGEKETTLLGDEYDTSGHPYAEMELFHQPAVEHVMRSPHLPTGVSRYNIEGPSPVWDENAPKKEMPSAPAVVAKATGIDEEFVKKAFNTTYASDDRLVNRLQNATTTASHINIHQARMSQNPDYFKHQINRDTYRELGITYAKQIKQINKRTPMELFHHEPASTEVTHAYSDPSMRATVPILGSYAHMSLNPTGVLTASEDLSEHSSSMVHHAKNLNLPVRANPSNKTAEVTNDIDLVPRRTHPASVEAKGFQEIPKSEIKAAKQHYRTLRGRSTNKMSEQFDSVPHPQLPGMENY